MARNRIIPAIACLVLGGGHALAQFTPVSTPTSGYTSSTTLIPITQADNASVSSISGGGQTVTLSTALTAHTVPGGGWSTWNTPPNTESATPRVLGTYSAVTSLTMTLATPVSTFGFEIEPDTFSAFSITATFMNGSTTLGSVTRTINGSAGALLAAATSSPLITSVVLTVPAGANGFAIAQIRFAFPTAVPTVGPTGMFGLGMALLAGGALLARKQQLLHHS